MDALFSIFMTEEVGVINSNVKRCDIKCLFRVRVNYLKKTIKNCESCWQFCFLTFPTEKLAPKCNSMLLMSITI